MFQENDIDATTIGLWGAVGAVLTFVIIMLSQVLYYKMDAANFDVKFLSESPIALVKYQGEQKAKLAELRWLDKDKGIAAIPIDRAMELVVKTTTVPPAQK